MTVFWQGNFILKTMMFRDVTTVLNESKHLKMVIRSVPDSVSLNLGQTECPGLTALHRAHQFQLMRHRTFLKCSCHQLLRGAAPHAPSLHSAELCAQRSARGAWLLSARSLCCLVRPCVVRNRAARGKLRAAQGTRARGATRSCIILLKYSRRKWF